MKNQKIPVIKKEEKVIQFTYHQIKMMCRSAIVIVLIIEITKVLLAYMAFKMLFV